MKLTIRSQLKYIFLSFLTGILLPFPAWAQTDSNLNGKTLAQAAGSDFGIHSFNKAKLRDVQSLGSNTYKGITDLKQPGTTVIIYPTPGKKNSFDVALGHKKFELYHYLPHERESAPEQLRVHQAGIVLSNHAQKIEKVSRLGKHAPKGHLPEQVAELLLGKKHLPEAIEIHKGANYIGRVDTHGSGILGHILKKVLKLVPRDLYIQGSLDKAGLEHAHKRGGHSNLEDIDLTVKVSSIKEHLLPKIVTPKSSKLHIFGLDGRVHSQLSTELDIHFEKLRREFESKDFESREFEAVVDLSGRLHPDKRLKLTASMNKEWKYPFGAILTSEMKIQKLKLETLLGKKRFSPVKTEDPIALRRPYLVFEGESDTLGLKAPIKMLLWGNKKKPIDGVLIEIDRNLVVSDIFKTNLSGMHQLKFLKNLPGVHLLPLQNPRIFLDRRKGQEMVQGEIDLDGAKCGLAAFQAKDGLGGFKSWTLTLVPEFMMDKKGRGTLDDIFKLAGGLLQFDFSKVFLPKMGLGAAGLVFSTFKMKPHPEFLPAPAADLISRLYGFNSEHKGFELKPWDYIDPGLNLIFRLDNKEPRTHEVMSKLGVHDQLVFRGLLPVMPGELYSLTQNMSKAHARNKQIKREAERHKKDRKDHEEWKRNKAKYKEAGKRADGGREAAHEDDRHHADKLGEEKRNRELRNLNEKAHRLRQDKEQQKENTKRESKKGKRENKQKKRNRPYILLKAIYPGWDFPDVAPKAFTKAKGVVPVIFAKFTMGAAEIGAGLEFFANTAGDKLRLQGAYTLTLTEDDIGYYVLGSMKGIWHSPMNIPFALENPVIKYGVEAGDGGVGVRMGLAGDVIIAGHKVGVGGDIKIDYEGVDIMVTGAAVRGSIDHMRLSDLTTLYNIGYALENGSYRGGYNYDSPIGIGKMEDFEFKDVTFAFVYGGTDPDLGFDSDGLVFRGEMTAFNQSLGRTTQIISQGSGIKIYEQVRGFEFEGFKFDSPYIDVELFWAGIYKAAKAPLTAKFTVHYGYDLLGALDVNIAMDLNMIPPSMSGKAQEKVFNLFEADIKLWQDSREKPTKIDKKQHWLVEPGGGFKNLSKPDLVLRGTDVGHIYLEPPVKDKSEERTQRWIIADGYITHAETGQVLTLQQGPNPVVLSPKEKEPVPAQQWEVKLDGAIISKLDTQALTPTAKDKHGHVHLGVSQPRTTVKSVKELKLQATFKEGFKKELMSKVNQAMNMSLGDVRKKIEGYKDAVQDKELALAKRIRDNTKFIDDSHSLKKIYNGQKDAAFALEKKLEEQFKNAASMLLVKKDLVQKKYDEEESNVAKFAGGFKDAVECSIRANSCQAFKDRKNKVAKFATDLDKRITALTGKVADWVDAKKKLTTIKTDLDTWKKDGKDLTAMEVSFLTDVETKICSALDTKATAAITKVKTETQTNLSATRNGVNGMTDSALAQQITIVEKAIKDGNASLKRLEGIKIDKGKAYDDANREQVNRRNDINQWARDHGDNLPKVPFWWPQEYSFLDESFRPDGYSVPKGPLGLPVKVGYKGPGKDSKALPDNRLAACILGICADTSKVIPWYILNDYAHLWDGLRDLRNKKIKARKAAHTARKNWQAQKDKMDNLKLPDKLKTLKMAQGYIKFYEDALTKLEKEAFVCNANNAIAWDEKVVKTLLSTGKSGVTVTAKVLGSSETLKASWDFANVDSGLSSLSNTAKEKSKSLAGLQ
jgi:hypothetical protein